MISTRNLFLKKTQKPTIGRVIVVLACVGAVTLYRSADAQVPKGVPQSLKPFAPVFQQFVDGYIARQGEKGLRPVVTSDFVWYTGTAHTAIRGDKAITQAAKSLGFADYLTKEQKGMVSRSLDISSSLPEIASNGKSAITHSLFSYGDMSRRGETVAVGGSALGVYKETWRKTPQGWRIAAIELESQQNSKKGYPVAKGDEGPLKVENKP